MISDNAKAFSAIVWATIFGAALVGLATLGLHFGVISGGVWMILIGFGSYLGYIPFGSFAFDRLFAMLGRQGTVGFLIYWIDAFAYIATMCLRQAA